MQEKNSFCSIFFIICCFLLARLGKNIIDGVIARLKEHFGVSTDVELAACLNVKQQTLSAWRNRGSIDINVLLAIPMLSLDFIFDIQQNAVNEPRSNSYPKQHNVVSDSQTVKDYESKLHRLEGQVMLLKDLLKEKDMQLLEANAREASRHDAMKRIGSHKHETKPEHELS